MPEDTTTDEQQVKRIIKRWRKTDILAASIMACTFLYVAYFFHTHRGTTENFMEVVFFIGSLAVVGCIFASISMAIIKRFANSLSPSEIELLRENADAPSKIGVGAKQVLSIYKAHGSEPQRELLRASTEPQDDTLLRAAAYTDNTPQEQLLRPANSDNTRL